MSLNIVKTITRDDGQRRVLIVQGQDGLFRFIHQTRCDIPPDIPVDVDNRERWAPLGPYGTICDTPATAEREARSAIDWLLS